MLLPKLLRGRRTLHLQAKLSPTNILKTYHPSYIHSYIKPALQPNSSDSIEFKGHSWETIGSDHIWEATGRQVESSSKQLGIIRGPPLRDNLALWGASGRHLGGNRETTSERQLGDHIWETAGRQVEDN